MTWLGSIHLVLMIGALGIGAGLFAALKGTTWHRRWGRAFVAAVLLSNTIVFAIYEDTAQIGVFHVLAMVSFGSVLTAFLLVRAGNRGPGFRIAHGHMMLWSFGGMVAAGLGQGVTFLGYNPWPAILATLLVVTVLAVRLDFKAMLNLA